MVTPKQLFEIHGYYDDDRSIIVKNKYAYDVMCHHIEPLDYNSFEPPVSSKQNNKRVVLREYRFGTKPSIFTGKCEVCGKVYYR